MIQNDLLISQKDSIFKLISNKGFNPNDFRWDKIGGLPTLFYANVEYFFKFQLSENPFERYCTYSPGSKTLVEEYCQKLDNWDNYLSIVEKWIDNLSNETSSSNLWERINNERFDLNGKIQNGRDLFTDTEIKIIKEKFELIKKDLLTIGLTVPEIKTINEKLDHLVDLAKDLNKIDWVSIVIGSILSLTISLLITPDKVKLILDTIKFYFKNWLILP